MPTKFSEFFTLAPGADDFQKRLYRAISDATTIVDCYYRIYSYITGGVKFVSRKARHDLMDNAVNPGAGFDPDQMNDAELYFGELTDLGTSVLFEYLDMTLQNSITYGPNVFSLAFNTINTTLAQTAVRQVQLYQQVQIYNEEYQRQATYHNADHTTKPLPNGPITINPAVPTESVDPDNKNQTERLENFVMDLVTWIKNNYGILQAVLHATP